jgi:hypothetical protein
MPRTPITPQAVTSAGLVPAFEPANVAGNSYRLAAGQMLTVKNGSGSSVTVTIPTPMQVDGLAVADRTYTVAAGASQDIALGKGDVYRQPGGVVFVNYSAVTSVTVAVRSVP